MVSTSCPLSLPMSTNDTFFNTSIMEHLYHCILYFIQTSANFVTLGKLDTYVCLTEKPRYNGRFGSKDG